MEWYSTVSGNVVTVREQRHGKVYLDRVGHYLNGESQSFAAETWAIVGADWFESAITGGFLIPTCRTIGGNWITEKDYIDSITA